jgi:DNA polymerase-4
MLQATRRARIPILAIKSEWVQIGNAMRKIIHVDMDAFFASVEQRDNPELRGKPVAVGGSRARGVVAAASYEARRFGVRSAMPSGQALRLCPDLIFVKTRFDAYRAVSEVIRGIFARYADVVEVPSLDEAYLDVTANRAGLPSATATARAIRADIFAATGLTASAGISFNKFLAKVASDQNKPDGQCVITPDRADAFLCALPVAKFHGIGPATAAKLAGFGLHTGTDLRAADPLWLAARFGKAGQWYHAIAHGRDDRDVRAHRVRKSIGSETTLSINLDTLDQVTATIAELAERVWDHARDKRVTGRTVTVKLRYGDFVTITRARSLPEPVADAGALHAVAVAIATTVFPLRMGLRLVGVTLSALTPLDRATKPSTQLGLAL